MLAAARRRAADRGVPNVELVHLRAEELPAGLGTFRVASFAQSFHWMDRPLVAGTVKTMLEPDGAWVHVHATTTHGVDDTSGLPRPAPPHDRIGELVRGYLGPVRRAGQGTLPQGTPAYEEEIMIQAGFRGPMRLELAGGRVLDRTEDEVVASVFCARPARRTSSASGWTSSRPSCAGFCDRPLPMAASANEHARSRS